MMRTLLIVICFCVFAAPPQAREAIPNDARTKTGHDD